ncbi:MAG: hypothetical protein IJZ03_05885 [Clostridia bacterium]|nr:hypothetical protein [Clostridia bacterium]
MKRLLAIILLACMALSFASCSAPKPDKTAEKYVKALVNGDIKAMSKYSAVKSKDIFNIMVEKMMKENEMKKSEVFETISEATDEKIKSFNDYCKVLKKSAKEDLEDAYGKKYKIKVSAVASEILEEDIKYARLTAISKAYDSTGVIVSDEINFSKIKECRNVTVSVYFYEAKTDYYTDVENFDFLMARIGNKWYVLDNPTALIGNFGISEG